MKHWLISISDCLCQSHYIYILLLWDPAFNSFPWLKPLLGINFTNICCSNGSFKYSILLWSIWTAICQNCFSGMIFTNCFRLKNWFEITHIKQNKISSYVYCPTNNFNIILFWIQYGAKSIFLAHFNCCDFSKPYSCPVE